MKNKLLLSEIAAITARHCPEYLWEMKSFAVDSYPVPNTKRGKFKKRSRNFKKT